MAKTRVFAEYGDNYYVEVEECDERSIYLTIHDEDGEKTLNLAAREARALATVLCHESEVVGT